MPVAFHIRRRNNSILFIAIISTSLLRLDLLMILDAVRIVVFTGILLRLNHGFCPQWHLEHLRDSFDYLC